MAVAPLAQVDEWKFLGGGIVSAAVAAFDWSATPLGPIGAWGASLRTAVGLVLRSPVPMALFWGPDGVVIYNDAFVPIMAGRHPSALGSKVRESWPEVSRFTEHFMRDVLTGKSFSYRDVEFKLLRNGAPERAWFDLDYSPVLGGDDEPVGVFALVRETTERLLASEWMQGEGDRLGKAVHLGEQRNRQILDSAIDYAIIAFDLDGRVNRWNEGARRTLGWTEDEMLGRDAACIFTPEDRASGRMQTEMAMALASGAGNDERWHLRKSGERFWANGEMMPIRGRSGEAIGFVKVLRDRTEQHRAAEKLRESEERLRRAQEAGGVGTFTVDLATDLIYGTAEFARIFGLDERESIAAAKLEALVVDSDAGVCSRAATRADQSAALDVEYRIRRANDGAVRWISRKAEYQYDDAGRVARLVGAVLDVTERKRAQEAIETSAEQFRTFAQAMPNHVWTAPTDGLLDWFNDRVYEYAGVARGSLDGHGWAGIIHPEDLAGAAERWSNAVASGDPYETEFRIRRADGNYRWHLARALALRAVDGSIGRWVGTNTDIHERKLAETRRTRDLDRIWTLSQELMMTCGFDGFIRAVNPSATRILGWTGDEMVGRNLAEFLHPDDVARTTAELGKLLRGVTTLAFENRYRTSGGAYRLLNWTAVPDGDDIHAVARDTTRERETEDALRQSQKMEAVGQLTGGVAHDFNNLLTIIRTSIDLMRRPNVAEDRRQRFMESISNAVSRAAKLTGQLLAFARRQALQPVVFDAAANVRSISDMIGTLVGSRITVDIDVPDEPCVVHADPNQMDTAIVNMAVNARDAMDGAGRLTISVGRLPEIPAVRSHAAVPGEVIAVSLTDTGGGIEPAQVERIFEPFFTTKAVGLGTGLGLSQVFGFAKQSGGDIQVESVVGQGTRFTLYLPEADAAGLSGEVLEHATNAGHGRGECILVVEDNADVAASVEQTLQELGYTTVLAGSAKIALGLLAAEATRFAAVFSDVVMAGMDGIELGYEIRRRHEGLAVVLSSGYSHVLATDAAHGFELLPKPYTLDALSDVLRRAIEKKAPGAGARRLLELKKLVAPYADRVDGPEAQRLHELDAMKILDSEEEAAYDDLTRMAATFCDAPIALISLIDRDRQWFKSRVGLQATETPREHAFCAHAIEDPGNVMVVNDATRDQRFAANPLVTGDPNIRFYAGAPLVTSAGHALGTICVIGREAREIDPAQLEMLQFLANQVVRRLEERRRQLTQT